MIYSLETKGKDQVTTEKDQVITGKHQVITEKDQVITGKDKELAAKDVVLAFTRDKLADANLRYLIAIFLLLCLLIFTFSSESFTLLYGSTYFTLVGARRTPVERCKIIFEFLEFILFYCVILFLFYFVWSTWNFSGAMLTEVYGVTRLYIALRA